MKVFVSCPFGLSSMLNNELKKLGMKCFDSFETGTYVDTDWEWIYKINFWSRIANKVFLVLSERKIFEFDDLFYFVNQQDRWKFIKNIWQISVHAKSHNSKLESLRTIQSISHKAIIKKLNEWNEWVAKANTAMWFLGNSKVDVNIGFWDNECKIMVNTSGESLHKRWYRVETGEAPIKENIAAGIILMSGWRFKDLLIDPFCGSGTILIEACLIAKNIAPGKFRNFAFEHFKNFDKSIIRDIREHAKEKEFEWDYKIRGFDIDPKMVEIAKKNIHKAYLSDLIEVEVWDFLEKKFLENTESKDLWVITNPPYGKRITLDDMKWVYDKLENVVNMNKWGFISWFEDLWKEWSLRNWNKKKMYNWADECWFWKK